MAKSSNTYHLSASENSSTWKAALVLVLIAIAVYANTLSNGFALDDYIVIKNNTLVTQGVSAVPELLATPYHRGHAILTNDLYRPLAMVMFAIEYQFFDGSPTGSHAINILVFAACVALLFLFLDYLFERRRPVVAFIAALLFALHPLHTEVVANIKSRDELLCFLLSFTALLLYGRYARSGSIANIALGLVAFFLALLAKETAITMLGIVPVVFFFYLNDDRTRSRVITAASGAIAAIYLAIRFSVLSKYGANHASDVSFIDNILSGATGFGQRTATAVYIMGYYLKLLFVPYPLVCDYSYNSIPFVSWSNAWVLLSAIAYVALAGLGFTRLVKQPRDIAAFGILFFLFTLSIFTNIPFLIGAAMAERFLFFASAGFCITIAYALEKMLLGMPANNITQLKNVKLLAALVPLCLVYAALTFARNHDWKDNTTLFKTDLAKTPGNSRMHYYLGTDLLISAESENDASAKANIAEEGIAHLKQSLAIYPGFALVNSELGNAYFSLKNYDSSRKYYEQALVQDPRDTLAIHNLAGVYYFLQMYQASVAQCRAAIAIDALYGRGYRNLGSCYLRLGRYDSAIVALRSAISIDPGVNTSYQNIAYAFKLSGNMDSARKYEAIARQRNPAFSIDSDTR